MSWEVRGGKKYYTRSRRVDGRVVREYVGGGIAGEYDAELDAEARARRQHELDRDRELQQQGQDKKRRVLANLFPRFVADESNGWVSRRDVYRKNLGTPTNRKPSPSLTFVFDRFFLV